MTAGILSRAAAYLGRRRREIGPFVRAQRILRRYTAHYREARSVYAREGHALPAVAAPSGVGVRVIASDVDRANAGLPADFDACVRVVAHAAAEQLDQFGRCDFFPAIDPAVATTRTVDVPEVRRGEVIAINLRDPFVIDGVHRLADPIVDYLERCVFGSHVMVDKLYIYRSPVSRQQVQKSWLWHYDNHPREMLKVMIYLTDVESGSAPFEYLARPNGAAIPGEPLRPLVHSRVPADAIDQLRSAGAEARQVTGPAGTVIVFDDNVIHRATLAQSRHRDVLVLQVRPAHVAARPRIDRRWTGTFAHRDFNEDPRHVVPMPRLHA